MKLKQAVRAATREANRRRLRRSNPRMAKKLSHMALS